MGARLSDDNPPRACRLDHSGRLRAGANLALKFARHPELAGVVVDEPLDDQPMQSSRTPARSSFRSLVFKDRFDERAASLSLLMPSLWFLPARPHKGNASEYPEALQATSSRSMVGWIDSSHPEDKDLLWRWLDDLPRHPDNHQTRRGSCAGLRISACDSPACRDGRL